MWTTEWPSDPGAYWFYGWASYLAKKFKSQPEMLFVEVSQWDKMVYIAGGRNLHVADAFGKWMKAEVPVAPDLSDL